MISILLLGDLGRTEFRDARACLRRWGDVRETATLDAATRELTEGGFAPGAIVVAQAFPGQFSHQTINVLRRLAPLARILGLMGSWCEGEMRTGVPWPATVRTYWHQWTTRCERELRRLTEGRASSWTLPVTATEEERLLLDAATAWSRRQGLIIIETSSAEMHAWLSAACRSRGFATVWQCASMPARTKGAAAVLFDGDSLGPRACTSNEREGRLRRLIAEFRPAPVIAMLGFPRIEDHDAATAAGAAAVLSKPLALEDLFWELDAALQAEPTQTG